MMGLFSKPKIKIAERRWYDVYYAPFEYSRRPRVFKEFEGDPVPFLTKFLESERDRIDAIRGCTGPAKPEEAIPATEVRLTHDVAAALQKLLQIDRDLDVKVPMVMKIFARGIVEELENMTNGKNCE